MTTQRLVTAPAERTPAGAGARAINSIGEPAQQDCQGTTTGALERPRPRTGDGG